MPNGKSKLVWLCIVLLILVGASCQSRKGDASTGKPFIPRMNRLVVVGFLPALSPGDEPGLVRSPFSGTAFMSEPVPQYTADKLTGNLFDRLLGDRRYELIPPSQARGVFSSLISADMTMGSAQIVQKIGQAFSADAVLVGYIYRWRAREGTDYAVRRPASVAFDLYLVRPHDGAILRKGRFDKSQRSLSENILDLNTFVKGGGKWMTAENLADLGLTNLLGKLPAPETKESE